jgi:hypothetical protein
MSEFLRLVYPDMLQKAGRLLKNLVNPPPKVQNAT